MPSGTPMAQGIALNERRKCKHPSCTNYRTKLFGYCAKHRHAYHIYGHPDARKIKPKEYARERERVAKVVNRNLKHPAIQQGIQFFDRWISRAVLNPERTPGGEPIARLADRHITGKECLIECAAIWVFAWWNKHLFPSDRAMTYGLGTTILYFHHGTQSGHMVDGKPRREAGEYIQKHIGVLLMRILQQVEKDEDKELERIKAINEPLK